MRAMLMGMGFFMCVIGTVSAQVSHTNDPSYSPNNYKHPNKAATTKKQVRGLDVKTVQTDNSLEANAYQSANGNYKMPKNKVTQKNQTLIILPTKPVEESANVTQNPANYKRQNVTKPASKQEPKQYVKQESDTVSIRKSEK